jgi:hypothetical protein
MLLFPGSGPNWLGSCVKTQCFWVLRQVYIFIFLIIQRIILKDIIICVRNILVILNIIICVINIIIFIIIELGLCVRTQCSWVLGCVINIIIFFIIQCIHIKTIIIFFKYFYFYFYSKYYYKNYYILC